MLIKWFMVQFVSVTIERNVEFQAFECRRRCRDADKKWTHQERQDTKVRVRDSSATEEAKTARNINLVYVLILVKIKKMKWISYCAHIWVDLRSTPSKATYAGQSLVDSLREKSLETLPSRLPVSASLSSRNQNRLLKRNATPMW